jgi:hypothetical protein
MKEIPRGQIERVLERFVEWLERYGETSWDHQTYFASPVGRRAKALYYRNKALGTMAVAPMILSEALAPSARCLFSDRLRFPIADAHYAMGFAFQARRLHGIHSRQQFPDRARKEPVPRIRSLLLGVSIRLGNTERNHSSRYAVDHDNSLRIRGVP